MCYSFENLREMVWLDRLFGSLRDPYISGAMLVVFFVLACLLGLTTNRKFQNEHFTNFQIHFLIT